jgi:probable F420-dependent oxidoreductase
MHTFRFGVVSGGTVSREAWITLARKAEDLGYSTLLMVDRLMTPLAPLSALAVAAQATTNLRVGSHVFANDFRHPVMLAREVATLNLLSDGRFELAMGAGVGPYDYKQIDLPFESAGVRVGRLEEALKIIKLFFSGEEVNFAGKYYKVQGVRGLPGSVQQPPIYLGCAGKRMLTLGAREADIIAVIESYAPTPDPAEPTMEQKLALVREAAGEQRFAGIELAYRTNILISDSQFSLEEQTRGLPSSFPRTVMALEETIEFLLAQREKHGSTYIQISEPQMESFAPIVARLRGK